MNMRVLSEPLPAHAVGAIGNFIPEVWSARLLRHLDKQLVFAQPGIINRDYEGEISDAGDTVHIGQVGDPTIVDYVRNTDLPAPQRPDGPMVDLVIDQQKAFNVALDDVDRAQAHVELLDRFAQRAGVQLADVEDQHVAAQYTAAGVLLGSDLTAEIVQVGGAGDLSAFQVLNRLNVQMNVGNVPRAGRWAIVPPWFEGQLVDDDKLTRPNEEQRLNGEVGRAAGFRVLVSNNAPSVVGNGTTTGDNDKIVAGTSEAITHATQVVKTEAYRIEKQFGDGVKGLRVYGTKVVQPDALAVASVADNSAG